MADEEVQEQEPQQEAQQEEGLLDSAQIAEPKVETPVEEIPHQEPTENGKPDWLPDRFWDDENGADHEALAKSQDELYKKLRGGKHQAPEDGNYDLKFLNEAIPEDDELLTNFKKIAADRGLTQDDFESIVGLVKDNMPSEDQAAEEKFDREQELAKLGPNGEDVINGHVKWAQSLVERGAWTSDDFEEFKVWGGTAQGIKALTKLRQYYGEKTIPVNVTPDGADIPTQAELESMIADPKYNSDPAYRQKVYKVLEKMNPNAEGVMPSLG